MAVVVVVVVVVLVDFTDGVEDELTPEACWSSWRTVCKFVMSVPYAEKLPAFRSLSACWKSWLAWAMRLLTSVDAAAP